MTRRTPVDLGWGGKTSHRQNFAFHSRESQPLLLYLPSFCGVRQSSDTAPNHKLAVKYDTIKHRIYKLFRGISWQYFSLSIGVFHSHLLYLFFPTLTAALFSDVSLYHFFHHNCSILHLLLSRSLSFPSDGMCSRTVEGRSGGGVGLENTVCNTVTDWC